ncbi:MAG: ATP synthase F1 subunit epsilon [Anaerolineae bacterium]|nr:ATP synthase F1 subunit epsilon [Anaerolineae bacterium]
MPLEVEVVSRVRQLYHTEKADMVIVPGSEGEMGVLPNHTPLLTTLAHGELSIIEGNSVVSFVVYGGVVEIRPDKVTVLADDAAELDEQKIEAARAQARELMASEPPGERRALIAQELRKADFAAQTYRRVVRRRGAVQVVPDESAASDED